MKYIVEASDFADVCSDLLNVARHANWCDVNHIPSVMTKCSCGKEEAENKARKVLDLWRKMDKD